MEPVIRADDFGLTVFLLRSTQGYEQEDLAREAGMSQATVSLLERGLYRKPPSVADLDGICAALRLSRTTGRRTLAFIASLRTGAAALALPSLRRRLDAFASRASDDALELGRAAEALLAAELRAAGDGPGAVCPAVEPHRLAAEQWARLAPYPDAVRRALVEEGREFQNAALCLRVCAESEEAAADSAAMAIELAELALLIARLATGERGWRARLEGGATAHLANALRVAGDLQVAKETFARALQLWGDGGTNEPGLLDPVKLLDLEASLRKDERKLGEALALLDRALALGPAPVTAGRLLINKANTLDTLGRNEEALGVLYQAAPLIEAAENPRLAVVLRFNVVVNLCELGRHAEGEPLLPEVRAMAGRLGKGLDLLRVRWLAARVDAGLGRLEEAIAGLESVRSEFAGLRIAYDAALATLELAVLLLEHGRMAEVQRLAEESKTIFDQQGVDREALATLQVFRQAAAREALTAALARRLFDKLRGKGGTDRGQDR